MEIKLKMHKKSKFHYYQIFPVKTAFKIKENTTIFWLSSPSALSCFLAGHVTSLGGFRLAPPTPPVLSLPAVPRRLFCFGSFVIFDVACCCLYLFSLCVDVGMGEDSFLVLD